MSNNSRDCHRIDTAARALIDAIAETTIADVDMVDSCGDQLLPPKDAAVLLGVSTSQLREMTKLDQIPHLVLPTTGRGERQRYRYRRKSLIEWIHSREEGAHSGQ